MPRRICWYRSFLSSLSLGSLRLSHHEPDLCFLLFPEVAPLVSDGYLAPIFCPVRSGREVHGQVTCRRSQQVGHEVPFIDGSAHFLNPGSCHIICHSRLFHLVHRHDLHDVRRDVPKHGTKDPQLWPCSPDYLAPSGYRT